MSETKKTTESGESGQSNSTSISGLTAQVMNNPQALALVQSKLAGMVGTLSGYYDTLPAVVKRRVKALKKLQVEVLQIEAEMYRETHAIECRYASRYETLFKKRNEIVNSLYEPNDDECDFPSDDEDEDSPKIKEIPSGDDQSNGKKEDENEKTDGIPNFWVTIFKNVDIINENIQEHDEPILEHLKDIVVKTHEKPMGFTLEFHFAENKFFTNTVLTKYYEMSSVVDEKDPFSFEGPEIIKCTGCDINWNKGENITVKTVNKKQKHKSKGSVRTVQKEVPADSFFNFFNPPAVPDNDEEIDEDIQEMLSADFEIGEVIRQRLVPRAVLYFTGEALDEDDDYDDEEDEDEEEEDEESSDDEDQQPRKKSPGSKGKGKSAGAKGNPEECKQQ